MVDLLPQQTHLWQQIEDIASSHFKRAALSEIRTPLIEATELFARGIGESTDVVGKEMYTFLDRGKRSCTLRPEGTASVVRAAIQHGLTTQGPQRLWYKGSMFRYERPQAGRQRQFHQIGVEYLGFLDPRSDIEVLSIAWDLLTEIGIPELSLELNTLGDSEERSAYRNVLVKWLKDRQRNLDEDSISRLETNPLRILDSKHPTTKELLLDAPTLTENLNSKSIQRFERIKNGLSDLGIPFKVNPRLVRGLDYYSHTAFEIVSNQLGAQATICGGGRYDGLVKQLGGSTTPAIGWALGMERLVMLLAQSSQGESLVPPEFYIVNQGLEAETFALRVARSLRKIKRSVELDLSSAAFGKQLKRANRRGARWALLIGDREATKKEFIIKDLLCKDPEASSNEQITMENLLARFA